MRETREALATPGDITLFEPALRWADMLVRADILERRGGICRLIEVKSSTRVKDYHITHKPPFAQNSEITPYRPLGAPFQTQSGCVLAVAWLDCANAGRAARRGEPSTGVLAPGLRDGDSIELGGGPEDDPTP